MAQHKASLEAILRSALAHKKAGSRMAETVASIEAMVLSGIDTAAAADSQNSDSIRRMRSALAHRSAGKRMQDAYETLQAIIAEEALTLTAEDIALDAQHDSGLRRIMVSSLNSRSLGRQMADMADLQDKVLDELLVIYGVGGAKDDAPTAAALQAIKDA